MKFNVVITLFIGIIIILTGCVNNNTARCFSFSGEAQGSTYSIVYYTQSSNTVIKKIEIDSILSDFDKSCSLYNPTSLISRLNSNETDIVDKHITACEALARKIYQESNGAYDITIKPLSQAYGFLRNKSIPFDLDTIMPLIGHDKISIKDGRLIKENPRISIDINSIAQGYSVDIVAQYIESKGIDNYLVEIGGEIYCKGSKPNGVKWNIGIDKPIDNNLTPGKDIALILNVSNVGINTSGNYRKFYKNADGKRINHTIDPRTGESATNDMLSATVIAKNAAIADGYATMFMVIGSEKAIDFLKKNRDLDGYIIYLDKDNNVKTFATEMIDRNSSKPVNKQ